MIKLPPDPGPHADFYTTIRYLQGMLTAIGQHVTQIEFNQKAHAMTTSDFQGSLDRNTAATAANTAASASEIADLKDISAQLKAALEELSTSQAPTQAQLDALNANSQALEDATAALSGDDAAPAEQPAGDPSAS